MIWGRCEGWWIQRGIYGISVWGKGNGPVKCVEFVEEFQMERCCGLAVDFAARTGLHGHDSEVEDEVINNGVDGLEWVSSSSF